VENLIASNRGKIGLSGLIRRMLAQPLQQPALRFAQLGGGLLNGEALHHYWLSNQFGKSARSSGVERS
jgi:hypothetical protein